MERPREGALLMTCKDSSRLVILEIELSILVSILYIYSALSLSFREKRGCQKRDDMRLH